MQSLILVQLLIGKLQNLLHDHDDSTNIHSNLITNAINLLESFQPILKFTRGNHFTEAPMNDCWMADLLSTLYSAEDAIDTFMARIELEKSIPTRRTWRDMCTSISKSKGSPRMVFVNQMNTLLAQLRTKVAEIPDIAAGCSSGSIYDKSVRKCWERISGSCLDEDAVDFLEPEQRKRLDEFLNGHRHRLIILAGGAGFGKTALAKLLYNRPEVKRRFQQRSYWVCASEIYKSRDVMAEILKQLDANAEEPILKSGILQKLATQVTEQTSAINADDLLVVIDDVRSVVVLRNIQDELRKFFKLFYERSSIRIKVIITSRMSTANSDCIQLSPLNEDGGRALFSKKNPDADSPMKDQTFKSCKGIPLAIGLIASLYSIEKSDLYDLDQYQEFANSENVLASVSSLCYQHLSFSLKPCFLYMGLFPRGFEIPVRRLYRIWEAEGFLPEDPEDETDKCFQELVCRNLIEIATWRSDGSPKTCRLPSTLHEIFSQKAKDIGFFHALPSSSSSSSSSNSPPAQVPKVAVRRLVACSGIKKYPPLHIYEEHLRTYISFNTQKRGTPITKELDMFLKRNGKRSHFTLLKVLDLENVYKPVLPEAMGEVFPFLAYLGLRSTALTWLSESVGKLSWLKTLDVKHTFITSLPVSIFKLNHVIHLYLNWVDLHIPSRSELYSLSQLRTVWGLSLTHDNHNSLVKWLEKSTGITKLGLQYLKLSIDTQGEVIDWILRQTNLQSLKLRSTDESGSIPSTLVLKRLADQLQKLTTLYLAGTLGPDAISIEMFPSSLRFLTLSMSRLKKDPMPDLGKLPHLTVLRLFGEFYEGNTLTCKTGGFAELQVLKLWLPEGVCEWIIEEAALPCIRQMVIRNIHSLSSSGVGIKKLRSLEELKLESGRYVPTEWYNVIHEIETERKNFHGQIDSRTTRSLKLQKLLLDAEF